MIPDIAPVNSWTGNNETKRFEFDFLINSEQELKVLYTNVNQVQTELKLNIDYSINEIGNKNGSYITFPLENSEYGLLQENETISLLLNIPLAQTTPFATSGLLNLNSLEYALDYIVRLIQIVYRQVERSVKIQEGSKDKPEDYFEYITTATTQANQYANQAKDYADESETLKIETQSARNQSLAYLNEVRDITENFDADIQELVGYVDEAKNEGIIAINNEKNNAINSVNEAGEEIIDKAEAWATSDKEIEKGLYSSKYYAELAKGYIPSNYTPLPIGSIIKVNASEYYTPSGFLPCDGSEYNKADFEKLWDDYLTTKDADYIVSSLVSIQGTPTFEKNMINNFSSDNYLHFAYDFLVNGGYGLVLKFKMPETIVSGEYYTTYNATADSGVVYKTDAIYTEKLDVAPNGTFYARYFGFAQDGDTDFLFHHQVSLDGNTWLGDETANNYGYIANGFSIGIDNYWTSSTKKAFSGSLDVVGSYLYDTKGNKIYLCDVKYHTKLNTCTYKEYEQDLVTYGQCEKFGVKPLEYDGSGLTIIGSPTITTEGVASGFVQGSSYITATLNINATKMIVRNKFNYKVNTASNSMLYWFNTIALRQFIVNNGDLRVDGTASPANLYINVPASNFKEGDVVETELIIDTSVKLNIKINGVSKNQYTSDRIPTLSNITQVGIGSSYYQGNNPYQGSIDLKSFAIEADNNTILQCGVGDTFKVPTRQERYLIGKKEPTTDDTTWFNLYSDGWCEQGGIIAAKVTTINLMREYNTTNYIVNTSTQNFGGDNAALGTATRTTTSFTLTSSAHIRSWEAKGYVLDLPQQNQILFIAVANGITDDCQATWNTLLELENYLKGV